jgi:hypothetical protein
MVWTHIEGETTMNLKPFLKFPFAGAAFAAFALFAGTAAAQPYAAWNQNRVITLNTTSTGANVAGNVTNFPVLIRLSRGIRREAALRFG